MHRPMMRGVGRGRSLLLFLVLGDVALGLGGEELVVAAATGHETRVVTLLDQSAILQHRNLGGHGGTGKAVGDEDGGLFRSQTVKLVEDLLLGHRIQRGGRLVQDEHVGVAVEGAGNG